MNMKRFAVIGLGHFGAHAARTLYHLGKEVIAIDADENVAQAAAEHATQAAVVDATDRRALEALDVQNVDGAIVSLGERIDITILVALHLVEMKVPYVAVKALTEEEVRILKAVGVHEVIRPERDMAIRLANRLARADVIDFLPLAPGYSITEIKAPPEFVGKTLRELALRNTLNIQLIAIETRDGQKRSINVVPHADDVIRADDLLILLGEDRHLDRIREIV